MHKKQLIPRKFFISFPWKATQCLFTRSCCDGEL